MFGLEDRYVRELLFVEEVLERSNSPSFADLLSKKFRGYSLERWLYVKRAFDKYGELWIVSAVVDGSIGYHTFQSAKNLLYAVLEHQSYLCERTSACYECDASLELATDIFRFEQMMRENPEKAKRIMDFVKKLEKLNWEEATTVSLMYPTLTI